MSISYEETGYRVETIWLKKIFFAILTLYPFFSTILPVMYSGNIFAQLVVQISLVIYVIGCIKLSTLITYLSILVSIIVQRIFLHFFNPYLLIINTIWIFLSEHIVDLVFKEKFSSSKEVSSTSILYSFQTMSILLVYIILAVIIAYAINYGYEYVLSVTPEILRVFYSLIIETRLGALVFVILVLYITHVFLNEYIYGLINDVFFSTKSYVQNYVEKFIRNEYENVVNMNDLFGKTYRRILLLIIIFILFPIFYPLLELFKFNLFPTILVIILNILLSIILYYIVSKYLRKILSIDLTTISIHREFLLFKIFLLILIIYVVSMILFSGVNSVDILATAIGLKQPSSLRTDVFSKTISDIYIGFSEFIFSSVKNYESYVSKTYSFLVDMFENIIKLLWG